MKFFDYNSPVIQFLTKAANLLIVSFYWIVCCIPLVTILPACAALYYSVTHVVFQVRKGVTKAFFQAFKDACKPGIALSVIFDVVAVAVYFGILTGLETWRESYFWAFYTSAGFLIAFLLLAAAIWLGPVLSRFTCDGKTALRLAFYFSGRKLLRSVFHVALLAGTVVVVDLFPLFLLVVPGLYVDLVRGGMEKDMNKWIEASGLKENDGTSTDEP